ncbi:hypothetical protein KUCAC02_006370 [Chaenocephalus aceratus]|uniref:Uncharacterized protein n=1 Tax=Chaenocephalus aceratus TaxID=36190 RepID=A0ACB9VSJ1_CHAAC|nr:hypothetical protein KUCAC02_006370 [Chaenocephalus aceratus]
MKVLWYRHTQTERKSHSLQTGSSACTCLPTIKPLHRGLRLSTLASPLPEKKAGRERRKDARECEGLLWSYHPEVFLHDLSTLSE